MMAPPTYAQRIARNYYQNMVPLPGRLTIAPAHARGTGKTRLPKGLKSLHAFMSETYLLTSKSPDAFHLPPFPDALPRAGREYGSASRSFARLPRLLFAIGFMGRMVGKGANSCLAVPFGDLKEHCKHAHVTRLAQLLSDLVPVGMLSAQVGQDLEVRFPGAPETAIGLSVFARAARVYTEDLRHPPAVFCRADLRILQDEDAASGPPKVTIEDVTRPLDEVRATVLRSLAACVETLGYRPQLKCSGLARGEWRGSYTNSSLGRTLLGFVVEENELEARLVFDTTPQIAPCIAGLPERLRLAVLRTGKCRQCGKCTSGPMATDVGGQSRRLCRSFRLTLSDLTAAEIKPLQQLAAAQDKILRQCVH